MASPLEEIKIALKITDANASEVVKKLESSFRGLAKSATQLDTKGSARFVIESKALTMLAVKILKRSGGK